MFIHLEVKEWLAFQLFGHVMPDERIGPATEIAQVYGIQSVCLCNMLGSGNDLLPVWPVHIPVIYKYVVRCQIEHINGDRHNVLGNKFLNKSQIKVRIGTVIRFPKQYDRPAISRNIFKYLNA